MARKYCIIFYFVILHQLMFSECQLFTSPNFFKPRFITGTTNGIYLAVVFPIDLPGREAYLGWFFEAIHSVPSNQTQYEYPPLVERKIDTIDRQYIYTMVENKINSKGMPGKECLLRTICEIAMYSVNNFNGVLGDILHVFLSPSTSKNLDLPLEYLNAEVFGKRKNNCEVYFKNCSISLLDLFSKINI